MKRRDGFSLIELLTVLGVLSVVSTLGVTMYFKMTSYWNDTLKREDMLTRADRAFDLIGDDIDHLLSASLSGVAISGVSNLDMEHKYKLVPPDNDQLHLPVEYRNPLQNQLVRANVMYHVDRTGGVPTLQRTSGVFGTEAPGGASELIAQGVLSMKLGFYDGAQWLPDWSQPKHPQALSVSLVLLDPDRPFEQVAARRVYTVRVE